MYKQFIIGNRVTCQFKPVATPHRFPISVRIGGSTNWFRQYIGRKNGVTGFAVDKENLTIIILQVNIYFKSIFRRIAYLWKLSPLELNSTKVSLSVNCSNGEIGYYWVTIQ